MSTLPEKGRLNIDYYIKDRSPRKIAYYQNITKLSVSMKNNGERPYHETINLVKAEHVFLGVSNLYKLNLHRHQVEILTQVMQS